MLPVARSSLAISSPRTHRNHCTRCSIGPPAGSVIGISVESLDGDTIGIDPKRCRSIGIDQIAIAIGVGPAAAVIFRELLRLWPGDTDAVLAVIAWQLLPVEAKSPAPLVDKLHHTLSCGLCLSPSLPRPEYSVTACPSATRRAARRRRSAGNALARSPSFVSIVAAAGSRQPLNSRCKSLAPWRTRTISISSAISSVASCNLGSCALLSKYFIL